jgi:O-antigen/teichoic acid export membrane protein
LGYLVDLSGALLALGFVVLTAQFAADSIVQNPDVHPLIILYALSLLPRAWVGTSNALLVSLGRSNLIVMIEMISSLLRLVLVIGLVLAGWQVAGVIWGNLAAAMALGSLYAVCASLLIRRACGAPVGAGKLSALKSERRQLLCFFSYNHLTALTLLVPQQLDVLLLGYFRGPAEAGYYRLAKNVAEVVEYLRVPLFSVSYAQLARISGADQPQAIRDMTRRLALWGLPLGVAVVAGAALLPFVLPLFVGERYSPAVLAAQILIVAAGVTLPFFWLRALYLVRNFVRELFIINSTVTIGIMLFYPVFVWKWGFIGAAAAMLALHILGTVARGLWLWKRNIHVTWRW